MQELSNSISYFQRSDSLDTGQEADLEEVSRALAERVEGREQELSEQINTTAKEKQVETLRELVAELRELVSEPELYFSSRDAVLLYKSIELEEYEEELLSFLLCCMACCPEGREIVLQRLKSENISDRLAASRAALELDPEKSPEFSDPLLKLLLEEGRGVDESIRSNVAYALAGRPEVESKLPGLVLGDNELEPFIVIALRKSPNAPELFASILNSTLCASTRLQAAIQIRDEAFDSPEIRSALVQTIRQGNGPALTVTECCIEALAALPGTEAELTEFIKSTKHGYKLRLAALDAVGRREEFNELFLKLLEDSDWRIRQKAACLLPAGTPEALEFVEAEARMARALTSELARYPNTTPMERHLIGRYNSAVECLEILPDISKELETALKHEKPFIRLRALEAAAGKDGAEKYLLKALEDPLPALRSMALDLLVTHPHLQEYARPLLKDPDAEVRSAALRALRGHEDLPLIAELFLFEECEEAKVRGTAADLLAELDKAELLARCLRDTEHDDVLEFTSLALAEFQSAGTIAAQVFLARDSDGE